jgi:photosystem II stability/assembly factor-like uncharacterized protein
LQTTNGGQIWIKQPLDTLGGISSVTFLNDSIGWITVSNGTLLKTFTKGNNWIQAASGLGTVLSHIQFIDANIGWVSFYQGNYLLKTIDGGKNWNTQFIDSNLNMYSFHFVNVGTGWAVGSYNGYNNIFKTINGGENWSPCNNLPISHFNSVQFIDENTGWAVGGYSVSGRLESTIIKTTDGGDNWIEQKSPPADELSNVYFLNENTGWVVGDGIFKTTNGGGIVSVKDEKELRNNIPEQIKLFQNYPNPFNPTTVIRYHLSKSGFVLLKVYDILGRVVNTLADKWQQNGEYKISWEANNLPSGVYFCRLRVGDFAETKKMLLIR